MKETIFIAVICIGFFALGTMIAVYLFVNRLNDIEEKTESLKRLLTKDR